MLRDELELPELSKRPPRGGRRGVDLIRGRVGAPSLGRQGDHQSKTSSLFHSSPAAAIRATVPSLGWESGHASFPRVSDLARGVV